MKGKCEICGANTWEDFTVHEPNCPRLQPTIDGHEECRSEVDKLRRELHDQEEFWKERYASLQTVVNILKEKIARLEGKDWKA